MKRRTGVILGVCALGLLLAWPLLLQDLIVDYFDYQDTYGVTLQRGETLEVRVAETADEDIGLYMLKPGTPEMDTAEIDSWVMAKSAGEGPKTRLSFTAPFPATYYLHVHSARSLDKYTLTLRHGRSEGGLL